MDRSGWNIFEETRASILTAKGADLESVIEELNDEFNREEKLEEFASVYERAGIECLDGLPGVGINTKGNTYKSQGRICSDTLKKTTQQLEELMVEKGENLRNSQASQDFLLGESIKECPRLSNRIDDPGCLIGDWKILGIERVFLTHRNKWDED